MNLCKNHSHFMFIKHKEDVRRQWPQPLIKLFRMQNEVHLCRAQPQQAITSVQEDQWWTSSVGLSEEDEMTDYKESEVLRKQLSTTLFLWSKSNRFSSPSCARSSRRWSPWWNNNYFITLGAYFADDAFCIKLDDVFLKLDALLATRFGYS
jgi:hypothetical protein